MEELCVQDEVPFDRLEKVVSDEPPTKPQKKMQYAWVLRRSRRTSSIHTRGDFLTLNIELWLTSLIVLSQTQSL